MNCLDCRRILLADPHSEDAELQAHLRGCASCRRFAGELAEFEPRLRAAMRVPVPEGLRERVIFAGSLTPRRQRRWLAAAAVLLLGIVLGYGGWRYTEPYRLADDMIAHMAKDPLHRQGPELNAGVQLAGIGAQLGVTFDADLLAQVIRSRLCKVDDMHSAHFVIERDGMRVTAFVLPKGAWPHTVDLEKSGMHGRIIETRYGVIALFCPDGRMLAELGETLRRTVSWQGV